MSMEPVRKIHHINFLVRDLDVAEQRYRQMLGLGPAIREALPGRGVLTARFRVGEVWLVLVQPTSEQGEPAEHLRDHGEGFFLISFAVDDLDAALAHADAEGTRLGSRLKAEQLRILLATLVLIVCGKLALDLFLQPSELYSLSTPGGH